jgi:hypothetical protein
MVSSMYSLWEGVPCPVEFSQLAPLNRPDQIICSRALLRLLPRYDARRQEEK